MGTACYVFIGLNSQLLQSNRLTPFQFSCNFVVLSSLILHFSLRLFICRLTYIFPLDFMCTFVPHLLIHTVYIHYFLNIASFLFPLLSFFCVISFCLMFSREVLYSSLTFGSYILYQTQRTSWGAP